jgi:hypothetical protein
MSATVSGPYALAQWRQPVTGLDHFQDLGSAHEPRADGGLFFFLVRCWGLRRWLLWAQAAVAASPIVDGQYVAKV